MPEQLSFLGRKTMRNLFFAIRPDAGATQRFAHLMADLHARQIMGRPWYADRLHISLHQVGEFIDQTPRRLVDAAATAAADLAARPFDVTFDMVGGTENAFFARASNAAPAIHAFRKGLAATLIKSGLRLRLNPRFTPHVTLSYGANTAPVRPITPVSWTVNDFALIESVSGERHYIQHGCWRIGQPEAHA